MKLWHILAAPALLLLAAEPAAAADTCRNPTTQVDMTRCAGIAYQAADTVLNRQWRVTLGKMQAADRAMPPSHDTRIGYAAALTEAQKAWLRFRDAECRIEGYQMRGGTGEAMVVNMCLEALTKTRTKQLKDMAGDF